MRSLAAFLLLLLLTGCVAFPTTKEEGVISQDTLNALEGAKREELVRRLGRPFFQAGDENGIYFVYEGGQVYAGEVVLPAPWPLMAAEVAVALAVTAASEDDEAQESTKSDKYWGDTFCYLFRVGSDGQVREVRQKSGEDLDCITAFFSADELQGFARRLENLKNKALNQGDAEALQNIQRWYSNVNVEKLRAKARMNALKRRYEEGDDTYELKVELAELGEPAPLEKHAAEGGIEAAIDLYEVYGYSGPLRKHAEQGNQQAIEILKGLADNQQRIAGKSRSEILEAAKNGDAEAQLQLSYDRNYYLDWTRWLCRSANNGHPTARYELAALYENGLEGVERDLAKAYLWYRLASESGHAWGQKNAERLAKSFSPSETIEADKLRQAWRPSQCEVDFGWERLQVD